MQRGFVYLCVILDWASRRVLAWRLSNTLTTDLCVEAVQEAITRYGLPEIFNTDQGRQFTSQEFTGLLQAHGIQRPHPSGPTYVLKDSVQPSGATSPILLTSRRYFKNLFWTRVLPTSLFALDLKAVADTVPFVVVELQSVRKTHLLFCGSVENLRRVRLSQPFDIFVPPLSASSE